MVSVALKNLHFVAKSYAVISLKGRSLLVWILRVLFNTLFTHNTSEYKFWSNNQTDYFIGRRGSKGKKE